MKRFKNWIRSLFEIKTYSRRASKVLKDQMMPLRWLRSEETSKSPSAVAVTEQTKEEIQKEAIASFVEAIGVYCGTVSSRSTQEIEALAVGFYDIQLTRFFGPTAMEDIDQYSDEFLGKIQKFQALRKYIDQRGEKEYFFEET